MTELKPYQSCRTSEGWVPVLIPSETEKRDYTVMVCPWNHYRENICECLGYLYGSHCKHQLAAQEKLCRWSESEGPEEQTEEQRKNKVCPRCGGPTSWQLEIVDEDDDS
jgi:hypothetical protein